MYILRGWYVGVPADRVDFGAHDFRGGPEEQALQETVVSDAVGGTVVSDGRLHMVALVVNQTAVSFYADAKLQSVVSLKRPITDCTGRALIIGAQDIPRLGEITFFPRQLGVTEMREIISSGFTFESLASGKEPFKPESTPFDTAGAIQSASFAQAEGQRADFSVELQVESSLDRLVTDVTANPVIPVVPAKIAVPDQPVSLEKLPKGLEGGMGEKRTKMKYFSVLFVKYSEAVSRQ